MNLNKSILSQIYEYPFLINIFNKLLSTNDLINVISCSTFLYSQKHKLRFHELIECYPKYKNKWYFNCLTNIRVFEIFKFPIFVSKIIFHYIKITLRYTTKNRFKKGEIPNTVVKLRLDEFLPPKNCIPNSVKRLYFTKGYDCLFIEEGVIPNSVEVLYVGNYHFSVNSIPNSVKVIYLFDWEDISNLPDTIEHLILGVDITEKIDKLPLNLKRIQCDQEFIENNKDLLNNIVKN